MNLQLPHPLPVRSGILQDCCLSAVPHHILPVPLLSASVHPHYSKGLPYKKKLLYSDLPRPEFYTSRHCPLQHRHTPAKVPVCQFHCRYNCNRYILHKNYRPTPFSYRHCPVHKLQYNPWHSWSCSHLLKSDHWPEFLTLQYLFPLKPCSSSA